MARHDQRMRELIYVSERKLRQFQPRKEPRSWWRRVTGVGATAPLNLGQMQITLSERTSSQRQDLAQVLRHLDRSSGQAPKSYAEGEGTIQPGAWVTFAARLNYKVVSERRFPDEPALLFWEPPPAGTDELQREYELACRRVRNAIAMGFQRIQRDPDLTPEERSARIAALRVAADQTPVPEPPPRPARLLLHGSPEHLVGAPLGEQPSVTQHRLPLSAPCTIMEFLAGQATGLHYPDGVDDLLNRLDRELPPQTASMMTGYARVSAEIELRSTHVRVVLASPLYVEYSTR